MAVRADPDLPLNGLRLLFRRGFMAQQKTYWHLLQQRRMPTEYEIVTSKLLCYTGEGFTGKRFELDVPLQDWYKRFQQDSPLTCTSWENFRDPRETTYTKYTEIQRDKEIFVDGILEEIEVSGYDGQFSPRWLHVLSRVVAPLRYPGHGLQMVASYVGKWLRADALSSRRPYKRATKCGACNELPTESGNFNGFFVVSQPIARRSGRPIRCGSLCVIAIEKLLICYDWAESFVGLNLVLKPLMDELFMNHLSDLALREGDYLLGQIFYSLNEDCQWHREWSQALTRMVIEDNSHNRRTIEGWIEKWHPVAARALQAFAPLFEGKLADAQMSPLEGVTQQLDKYYQDYLSEHGLATFDFWNSPMLNRIITVICFLIN